MKLLRSIVWLAIATFSVSAAPEPARFASGSIAGSTTYDFIAHPPFVFNDAPASELTLRRSNHDANMLVISCMDFRLISHVHEYMEKISEKGAYDYVVLAGASLGVNNSKYPEWGRAFWEHVDLSLDLHHIKTIMIIDHRNCGAYKLFLQEDFPESPNEQQSKQETADHKKQLDILAKAIHLKYPSLGVQTRLMALDGSVEEIGNIQGDQAVPTRSSPSH